MNEVPVSPTRPMSLARGGIQRALQILTGIVIYGGILFACAGRLDWSAAWYFLAVNLVVVAAGGTLIFVRSPGLILARARIRSDIETWDKWVSVFANLAMFANLAIPGLDFRFGWSTAFPILLQVIGFLGIVAGYALMVWAMLNNPFFESGVRLQGDRGQTVATSGPYRFVRHPGYVGVIVQLVGTALALAS